MTTTTESRVRSVLAEPRGHRFSRPGSSHPTANSSTAPRLMELWPQHTLPQSQQAQQEQLSRQVEGNPKVTYMLEHGEPPHRVKVAAQQRAQHTTHTSPPVPRPRPAPDDGPRPKPQPLPRRPRSHRKPRRTPWRLITYTLTATAGALAHHLTNLFF